MTLRSRRPATRRFGSIKPEIDEDAATELLLYMDNDRYMYGRKLSFIRAVQQKIKQKKYDPQKAPALWSYYVTEGAKRYEKEFSTLGSMRDMFPKKLRDVLAMRIARDEYEAIRRGEYQDYTAPDALSKQLRLLHGR